MLNDAKRLDPLPPCNALVRKAAFLAGARFAMSTWAAPIKLLLSVGVLAATSLAAAQDFPSKPVRLVVPNSAGSTSDVIARLLAPEMGKALGQPIVIENKPGAGQVIGNEFVMTQAADGYTIALVFVEGLASLPATVKQLRFDPLTDIPPFIGLVEGRWVLGSAAQLPWKTFAELVANISQNPGKLNWGSPTHIGRLLTEVILREKGLDAVFIPYAGGSQFATALLSGSDIGFGLNSDAVVIGWGERFRVLAVTGDERSRLYPQAPTFRELGFPQIPGISYSLNARAGTPGPILDKLRSAAARALQNPEVRASFARIYFDVAEQSPAQAKQTLLERAKLFSSIAKQIGLEPE
jgi:tripartite-type tricarboxylate transporter receptor subunit TctC